MWEELVALGEEARMSGYPVASIGTKLVTVRDWPAGLNVKQNRRLHMNIGMGTREQLVPPFASSPASSPSALSPSTGPG